MMMARVSGIEGLKSVPDSAHGDHCEVEEVVKGGECCCGRALKVEHEPADCAHDAEDGQHDGDHLNADVADGRVKGLDQLEVDRARREREREAE
jgi:hypothetical protein